MKNKIMGIIIFISVIILIILMFVGIKIRNFEILSVSQINKKDEELNEKITQISNLTAVDYQNSIDDLEKTYEKYTIEKSKYEEIAGFNKDDEENSQIYEKKQYDIEYLWEILGRYATVNNVTLGIDVQKSNVAVDLYDLNFTVSGEYLEISEFIREIENDSDLNFRIYNFKMTEEIKNEITIEEATFVVKDINIKPTSIIPINKSENKSVNNTENVQNSEQTLNTVQ